MATVDAYPIPRSALLFMATVEEARRTNEGPFRAIAPIFRLALEPQRGQLLNVSACASMLAPILGDGFTQHAMEAFLPQLAALGWLVEEPAGAKSAYRVPSDLPGFDEAVALETSSHRLNRLYSSFQEFISVTAPLLKVTFSSQEFQWQIFKWATSLDGSDKEAVRAEAEHIVEGSKPSAKNAFLDEPQRFSKIDKQVSVEFAGFVKWLGRNQRPELSDIASLTELGLAIEFIEEIRNPNVEIDFKTPTIFILDAPVLLDMLGLSGSGRKDSIHQTLSIIRDRGGRLATLPHCLQELSDIIKAVLDRPEARRFGLTGDALRADPTLVGRARQIANQPDQAAKLASIELLHFDRKSPLNADRFDDVLIDRFRNTATWHDQYKSEQRERDALSIAYVMRRRQGKTTSDALETPFLLVTRNSTFTRFSELFVKRNLNIPDYAFGPAIETKTLAAAVWMRFGSTAEGDTPKLHLVSACDRILATNGELLRRAEKRLKEMKGDDAAAAILSSQQAVLDLVVAVGGSADVLDAANAGDLLRAFTATAEERGRMAEREIANQEHAALSRAIEERDRQARELEERTSALALEGMAKDARLRKQEAELEAQLRKDQERASTTAEQWSSEAARDCWRVVGAVWAIATAIAVLGQFFIWQGIDWWMRSPSNAVAGAIVIACTVGAASFGLRLIPPGKIDLAGAMHAYLVRKSIVRKLGAIPSDEERERIRGALRAGSHI